MTPLPRLTSEQPVVAQIPLTDQRSIRLNYYGAKELAESFRTVRKNTITIAEEIPEDQYGFRPAPDTRTVSESLAHIALSPNLQHQIHGLERRTTLDGFDFPAAMQRIRAEEKVPRSKAQTIALLQSAGVQWAAWLDGLTESFLGERVEARPGIAISKSRFEMILSVKEHEMHHRGQLMLIERIIGIVPHLTRAMQARHAAPAGKS